MKNIKIQLIPFLILFFASEKFSAQDFSYQFNSDSTGYISIIDTSSVFLTYESSNQEILLIPDDFEFNFAGKSIDTIRINPNGYLSFDRENKFNFLFFFKEFLFNDDSINKTLITYKKEVLFSEGSVFKIEFKNLMYQVGEENAFLNFQIFFYQNTNTIEFRMGSVVGNLIDGNCMFGLINMFDPVNSGLGFLLSGDSKSPTANFLPENSNPSVINLFPKEGTIYTFTKNAQ